MMLSSQLLMNVKSNERDINLLSSVFQTSGLFPQSITDVLIAGDNIVVKQLKICESISFHLEGFVFGTRVVRNNCFFRRTL